MKKMMLGIILLLLTTIAVSVNSYFVDNKLSEIRNGLIDSLPMPSSNAESYVKKSFQSWEDSCRYLRIVISDSRLEKISDGYFMCLENPHEITLRKKLINEIEELIKSEKISIQSLF
ncbi:MAG: hypothetical protein E7420_04245 [Ruminococcaceae bacterium]|nr:hypothetical protein [Oscillospiraceae bacterium]